MRNAELGMRNGASFLFKKLVVLFRKPGEEFAEVFCGVGFQVLSNPPSIVLPDSDSSFASSIIQCNFPSEAKSFSICLSQSFSNLSKIKAARISCSFSDSSLIRSMACASKAVITVKYGYIIFSQYQFSQGNLLQHNKGQQQ